MEPARRQPVWAVPAIFRSRHGIRTARRHRRRGKIAARRESFHFPRCVSTFSTGYPPPPSVDPLPKLPGLMVVSPPPRRHCGGVDSTDLTQVQADALRRQIARHLTYLRRLKDRMDARGFPEHDLLYTAAVKAVEACEQLHRQTDIRAGTYRRRAGKSRGA